MEASKWEIDHHSSDRPRIPSILGRYAVGICATSHCMTLREIFAANLRRLRHASGLTQEELAHRAGFNRNYIGMLERAANSPTVDAIEKIATVFSVDPARFFDPIG